MEEMEGTYRVLQTPGARLGTVTNAAVSTLEPGQSLSIGTTSSSKPRGRGMQLTVQLLDDVQEQFEVEQKANGQALMDEICQSLNLVENDYFGLEFRNNRGNEIWLEPAKPIVKQVQRPKNTLFRLCVKFFPPDPGQLLEEYTRYLFALQIKRDLAENKIICSENTSALLISHILQSEIGDCDEAVDLDYLKNHILLPNQQMLQEKIIAFHRQNIGQTPAESDFQVLEIARKLEMYGIRFHPATDREGTKINLAVAHMGVLVFQGNTKINTFNWAKIRKLSFKRKRFLIKLHPEDSYQESLEFLLPDRDLCKIFWKNCVEYHTFFRLLDQPKPKAKAILFTRGSSFRYSGRTQKQLVDYMRESVTKTLPYQRRHSRVRGPAQIMTKDVPKKSLSFTGDVEVPGSPFSAAASFQSVQSACKVATDSQSIHRDDGNMLLINKNTLQKSPVDMKMSPTMEETWKTSSQPSPISFQGSVAEAAGSCSRSSSGYDEGSGLTKENVSNWKLTQRNDNDEDDCARDIFITENNINQLQGRAMPVFTLTNTQLQLTEEFIDDDPAEISFFAGGSEAFSPCYHGLGNGAKGSISYNPLVASPLVNARLGNLSCEHKSSNYVNDNMYRGSEGDLEFEGESDLNGNGRPIDSVDLFEVKAQANRLHECYSKSETSSLLNNQSQSSSLTNLGLNGLPDTTSFRMANSANQSEASSMVNFPTYSVRSESSSALQFGDVIEQLEQLSYPPTTTEDSSSEFGSWDSDSGAPLDSSLFYSNPFAQVATSNFTFNFKNEVNGCTLGEQEEKGSLNETLPLQ
ncbi:FERM, ARHGEF and pleckstrin domain-containing protein 2 [Hemitrygon akajei]|uniref:FERM, ARHGEF and pleckstrin domain-containing protein 2 n=1 Tax=Hemitrygon akajei TaxID=2704970 RepID=UPI003BF99A96